MGPAPLPPGLEVTYHRLCLGGRDGGNFATWANFSETVLGGRAPAVLKMDIEGYEWEVLEALTTAEARAGLPLSISLELHYRGLPGPWADRDRRTARCARPTPLMSSVRRGPRPDTCNVLSSVWTARLRAAGISLSSLT